MENISMYNKALQPMPKNSVAELNRSVLNCPKINHIIICIFILLLSLPFDIVKL